MSQFAAPAAYHGGKDQRAAAVTVRNAKLPLQAGKDAAIRDLENSFVRNAVAVAGKQRLIIEVVKLTGKAYKSTEEVLQDLHRYEDGLELEVLSEPVTCSKPQSDGDVKKPQLPSSVPPAKGCSSGTGSMPPSVISAVPGCSNDTGSVPPCVISPVPGCTAAARSSPAASGVVSKPGSQSYASTSSVSSKAATEEALELRRLLTCKVCLEELVCITFVPCGHLVSCAVCAPALHECPICRKAIRGTVKTLM